jgi:erythromycin esterase
MTSEVRMRRLGFSFVVLMVVVAVAACATGMQGGAGTRYLAEVTSAELARRDSVVSWLADSAIPIHGVTPGSGLEDLRPLAETLRDVRVIGLGEATHGTHEFFRFKHRLFEFLVREMGVRVLAFEASQSAAENVVNPYVQGGPGNVEEVVASLGLPGGWEEIRDLVAWMRDYNQGVYAGERVRFVGFDIQYNDDARRVVLEYLRGVAPERVAPTEALFQVPVDSLVYVPYLSRDTTAARMAAAMAAPALRSYRELYEFVRTHEERFATQISRDEAEHLLRHVRVLDQFAEVYGRLLAGPEEFNHLLRDRYMAENFRRMLDAQPPDARAAVWAHNLHLMADSSAWSARPMGRHLRETYGSAYYALALGLGEGTFMACDIASDAQPYWALAQFDSGPPRQGTVDWYLTRAAERAGARQFFLDFRGAPTTGVVGDWLSEPRGMFVVTSVYSPEWGATYASYPTSLAVLFDGVAFFQSTTAARPLPLGDCPNQIYR